MAHGLSVSPPSSPGALDFLLLNILLIIILLIIFIIAIVSFQAFYWDWGQIHFILAHFNI
jgi:hypothetical protein